MVECEFENQHKIYMCCKVIVFRAQNPLTILHTKLNNLERHIQSFNNLKNLYFNNEHERYTSFETLRGK